MKKKHPGGRPTKFTQKMKDSISLMARRGFTDQEMSDILGITERTINNWKKRHSEFFQSLKDWKIDADRKVELSLYERACGYSHPETKAQWVESDILVNGEFKKIGRWEYAELTKHYPPDSTSIIFWLKNRQPEKWRDKQSLEIENKEPIPLEDFYKDADPKPEPS